MAGEPWTSAAGQCRAHRCRPQSLDGGGGLTVGYAEKRGTTYRARLKQADGRYGR